MRKWNKSSTRFHNNPALQPRPILPKPMAMHAYHLNRAEQPYQTIPFKDITLAQLEESILHALDAYTETLAAITQNADTPTFANTIEPYERSMRLLNESASTLSMLEGAASTPAVEQLGERMHPHIASVLAESIHRFPLWKRVKHVWEHKPEDLSPEQNRLLDLLVEDLRKEGCDLSATKQQQFREAKTRLAKHTGDFSRNRLHATKDFSLHLTRQNEVSGITRMHLKAAKEKARRRGIKGWIFTLDAPSYTPFMTFAHNRKLRKKLYMARHSICTVGSKYDNQPVAWQILEDRYQLARLLNYSDYASYILTERMAQTPQQVEDFLQQLIDAYLPQARREVKAVREEARADGINTLQPWDFEYYTQRLKKRLYDFESEELRPYLQYETVEKGIFNLAHRLYGISFEQVSGVQTWAEEVKVFRVVDNDDSLLGLLYIDPFPRNGKQAGAWMTNLIDEYIDTDHKQRPHVAIVMNLTPPTTDTPSLLTLSEVETFLHEFGHALHGLFANTRYATLSGTNVFWDFVELPSQFMENFSTEPQFINTIARHYQTGEQMPETLLEKVRNARQFMAAYNCIRQICFGRIDMALYHNDQPVKEDLETFEHKVLRPIQLLRHPKGCCTTLQFGHIMSGGYAAGYYSYKWAETLDADAFSLFQENGVFSAATAEKFRREILEKGGTVHPMTLYQNFRGRKPTIKALLQRDGIQPKKTIKEQLA